MVTETTKLPKTRVLQLEKSGSKCFHTEIRASSISIIRKKEDI